MERLPNSSSRAYGPNTELSRTRACVPLGCFSTLPEFVTLGARIFTSSHHPFPPTCRCSHRSRPWALRNKVAEENTKRLQSATYQKEVETCSPGRLRPGLRETRNEDCQSEWRNWTRNQLRRGSAPGAGHIRP